MSAQLLRRSRALPARRSPAIVAGERASVLACLAAAWGMAAELLSRAGELSALAVALALPGGMLAADFAGGAFHWACDRFGSAATPLLGPLIGPFRDHHARPAEILDHGFAALCGGAALGIAPLIALGWAAVAGAGSLPLAGFLPAFWLCLCLFAMATNQLHAWAHGPGAPLAIRRLQERGVLLSRAAHARHHRGRHDCGYCITTGWLNPLLDAVGFWSRLERVMQRR